MVTTAVLVGVIGTSLASAKPAYAIWPFDALKGDESSESTLHPFLQKLVDRFGLDETEVQAFVTETREERRADKEAAFATRLEDAVAAGTISEDQKGLIEAKHEEMQTLHEDWQGLSREERRDAMESHHKEMEAWVEENGIDLELLGGYRTGFKKGFGHGMHMGHRLGSE